jgi:hypothetical protein
MKRAVQKCAAFFVDGRDSGQNRQATACVILTSKETGSVAPAKAGAYRA